MPAALRPYGTVLINARQTMKRLIDLCFREPPPEKKDPPPRKIAYIEATKAATYGPFDVDRMIKHWVPTIKFGERMHAGWSVATAGLQDALTSLRAARDEALEQGRDDTVAALQRVIDEMKKAHETALTAGKDGEEMVATVPFKTLMLSHGENYAPDLVNRWAKQAVDTVKRWYETDEKQKERTETEKMELAKMEKREAAKKAKKEKKEKKKAKK